mmetsp:Transcript_24170/g.63074  ORF Transcript_24170/g.63074 Transcript_24170/m.63074 type:complete len:364 (-) Transcript_24170:178-1269(-)
MLSCVRGGGRHQARVRDGHRKLRARDEHLRRSRVEHLRVDAAHGQAVPPSHGGHPQRAQRGGHGPDAPQREGGAALHGGDRRAPAESHHPGRRGHRGQGRRAGEDPQRRRPGHAELVRRGPPHALPGHRPPGQVRAGGAPDGHLAKMPWRHQVHQQGGQLLLQQEGRRVRHNGSRAHRHDAGGPRRGTQKGPGPVPHADAAARRLHRRERKPMRGDLHHRAGSWPPRPRGGAEVEEQGHRSVRDTNPPPWEPARGTEGGPSQEAVEGQELGPQGAHPKVREVQYDLAGHEPAVEPDNRCGNAAEAGQRARGGAVPARPPLGLRHPERGRAGGAGHLPPPGCPARPGPAVSLAADPRAGGRLRP